MFAIEITDETLPKIMVHQAELDEVAACFVPECYVNKNIKWYYIRGYITERGALETWAAYPESHFNKAFEHNSDKIKTDWDIVVRK